MSYRLPQLRWAVRDLLPEGYTVFAGPPKLGKTWIVYLLAASVALPADLWGRKVDAGNVLILPLEDGERRAQARLERVLAGRDAPNRLHIATQWPRLHEGGMDEIERWATQQDGTGRLVIIDTFQRLRPPSRRGVNAYEEDYKLHAALHTLAHRAAISIIAVTHMRKGSAGDRDWLESVTGSTGVTGAADSIWALRRNRGNADGSLHIIGRDVADQALALKFDAGIWSCLGDTEQIGMSKTRKAILQVIAAALAPLRPAKCPILPV